MNKWLLVIQCLIEIIVLCNHAYAKNRQLEERLFAVTINQQSNETIYVLQQDNTIWVKQHDLENWNFILPDNCSPLIFNNEKFYLINSFSGLTYYVDQAKMELNILAPPELLKINGIELSKSTTRCNYPCSIGVFVNYDISLQQNSLLPNTLAGGVSELGIFNKWGIGLTSVLYGGINDRYFTRLESRWQYDSPSKMRTLILGDSITKAVGWSCPTRFGGIQWGTNFNIQPNYITFPLPTLSGMAALPSALDVLVNQNKIYATTIPPGPYLLNNIPTINGEGTITVHTTDVLGREQVIHFPFYTCPMLLKPGLTDYSLELGWERYNYSLVSNSYANAFLAGTYRYGINPFITTGIHTECATALQNIGLSSDLLWRRVGIISLESAASLNGSKTGGLMGVSFIHQDANAKFSYGFQTTLINKNFQQLGINNNDLTCPCYKNRFFIGYSAENAGNFGLSYYNVKNVGGIYGQNYFLASYSKTLFQNLFLNLTGFFDTHNHNNQYSLALVYAFKNNTYVSSDSLLQNKQFEQTVQIAKPLPLGVGYGYQANLANNLVDGSLFVQTNVGAYTGRYLRYQGNNNYQLDATGGIVHFNGKTFFSQQGQDSFALVRVPAMKNVRVYYRNQLMGRTNAKGEFVIQHLLPYQENEISIETKDLPFDTMVQSDKISVVPYYRSGVLVCFPITQSRSALLRLVDSNNKPLPPGLQVEIKGECETYYTGYNGEVFLNNIHNDVILGSVFDDDHQYHFSAHCNQAQGEIYYLNNVECR